jgi:membrane protease YdiL (CAAX protease family)
MLAAALPVLAVAALLPAPLWTFLLFAPICEELVFRAGLQESLLRRLEGPRTTCALIANVLTSVAFAAAHALLRPGWLACMTVLPSLLLGRVYQQHRRLDLCVGLHALFNVIWLLWADVSF